LRPNVATSVTASSSAFAARPLSAARRAADAPNYILAAYMAFGI
jgi:hypothetical protein